MRWMWSPPATQLHTSVPSREKGHCDGRSTMPGRKQPGQSTAGSLRPMPWTLWDTYGCGQNSTAGSSSHTSVTASTLHLSLSPHLLQGNEDSVQGMGSEQPLGSQLIWHRAGCSFAVGQAAASRGFCAPLGLELFRFWSKCSKLGYASLLLWHPKPSIRFMKLARQPREMFARTWS